jgi:hypothetical protein
MPAVAAAGSAPVDVSPAVSLNSGAVAGRSNVTAVVPASRETFAVTPVPENEWPPFGPLILRLPVEIDVMVPVRDFRVRNLLALVPGQVVKSRWGHAEDVPLSAGPVPLAWSEFEVMDSQLAVRITRLS